jgi:hypothetical protein
VRLFQPCTTALLSIACGSESDPGAPPALAPEPTGGLEIITTTTGPGTDPDGYELMVNGSPAGPMAPSDTVVIRGFPAAQYSVGLFNVVETCKVGGGNPRGVRVVPPETARAIFVVKCEGPEGPV